MHDRNDLAALLASRDGLRVVGDIHGESASLKPAVAGLAASNLAALFLGDVINRGPDSPGAVAMVLELVEAGRAALLPGNHEWRMRRALAGASFPPHYRRDIDGTLGQFRHDRPLLDRYMACVAEQPAWRRCGRYVFAHGAVLPAALGAHRPGCLARPCTYTVGTLLGQGTDRITPWGTWYRAYDWVDRIPAGVVAVIGHDVIDHERVLVRRGRAGGCLVHLDTGCSVKGKLSWRDLSVADLAEGRLPADTFPFEELPAAA